MVLVSATSPKRRRPRNDAGGGTGAERSKKGEIRTAKFCEKRRMRGTDVGKIARYPRHDVTDLVALT
jgi:hypothetical protein